MKEDKFRFQEGTLKNVSSDTSGSRKFAAGFNSKRFSGKVRIYFAMTNLLKFPTFLWNR